MGVQGNIATSATFEHVAQKHGNNQGLPSGIHYYAYGILSNTKMSLKPKQKYLAKQTLINKYSE
jgi:hypothetical protein